MNIYIVWEDLALDCCHKILRGIFTTPKKAKEFINTYSKYADIWGEKIEVDKEYEL